MPRTHPLHIGVTGDRSIKAERERISGVLRYVSQRSNLQIEFFAENDTRKILRAELDGAIGRFSAKAQRTLAARMPVVTFEADEVVCGAGLSIDNEAIARQAFSYFQTRGMINFAYVASDLPGEAGRSQKRESAFAGAAAEKGFSFSVYHFPRADRNQRHVSEIPALSQWLSALPKPCAVMAYADSIARVTIDACHYAHLSVPDQVQVIGVDNDLEICENTQPSITSIWPDFYEAGHRAAEFLDTFLRTGMPKRPINGKYGVRTLVERTSTVDLRGGGRLVSLANDYLRQNFRTRLNITDLAGRLNVSRRLLDLRYREIMGRTLHEEWDSLRIDEAKRLLSAGLPVESAYERCGFGSVVAFRDAFRRMCGVNPSDWPALRQ